MAVFEVTENQIRKTLSDLYGLSVQNISKCNGYDDVTMRIEAIDLEKDPLHVEFYILKILSEEHSKDMQSLLFEVDFMDFVSNNVELIQVPEVTASKYGRKIEIVAMNSKKFPGAQLAFRLSRYISGHLLLDIENEPSPTMLKQLGELIGQLSNVTEGFRTHRVTHGNPLWSMSNICERIPSLLHAVDDPERRKVFEEVIDEFGRTLEECGQSFERGVIHGDINEGNLIIELEGSASGWNLKGLIDFSDCHVACRVFELTLAICYMMLECDNKQTVPIAEVGGWILSGFLKQSSLSDAEWDILKTAIEARIVQSMTIGLYTFKYEQPGNQYVLTTQKPGWKVLKFLRSQTKETLYSSWKRILPL